MLYALPEPSDKIESVERGGDSLVLTSQRGRLRVTPVNETILRITYTTRESFSTQWKPGILPWKEFTEWTCEETDQEILLHTGQLSVRVDRVTGSVSFLSKDGAVFLRESDRGSHSLEEFQTFRTVEDETLCTEKIRTPDGVKEVIRSAARVPDKKLFHTRLNLRFQEEEALYGLGQHEEGIVDLRGHMVYLHQANRKIAIPVLVSSLGYGILMNTDSPMIFSDTEYGSYLYTEAEEELDYFFLGGGSCKEAIRGYRILTGKAALLPKWAFGYMQSQERYESAEELLQIGREHRERGIGVDCLVLDWCSWEDGMWGQKSFDKGRFPDPASMMEKLHEMDLHLLVSVWPNMDPKCENHRQMKAAGNLLPGGAIYNAFSEDGRRMYWQQAYEGIYRYGVDGWWCDSSEPITPEWNHKERVEPAIMYAEYVSNAGNLMPIEEGNAYGLYHARALFQGQTAADREAGTDRRVINLTRSAWTGSQRYGTILWSGDIAATWDTFRRQIAAGIQFCASGLPFWTTDIGAFFVKNSVFWYWKGDYDNTTGDLGYQELFVRWYQWGSMLPIFRGHGTDCRRELWQFDGENQRFYNALLSSNRRRYQLMPYIYSLAGKTWALDESMMMPLGFAFPKDKVVHTIADQYLFGEELMVCPVTRPMYFEAGSKPVDDPSYTRRVYLPGGTGWFNFDTKEYFPGGQWIEVEAPLEKLPVFVREGSILPMTEATDRVLAEEPITYQVYGGADGTYQLYRDAGDGYAYENGAYRLTTLTWNDAAKTLTDDQGVQLPCELFEKTGCKSDEKREDNDDEETGFESLFALMGVYP